MSVSFFTLPVEVFQCHILPFLTSICLSQLDGAVLNRSLRNELIQHFENAVVQNEQFGNVFRLDPCSLMWLLRRRIYLTHFFVERNDMREYCFELSSVVVNASRVSCRSGFLCGEHIVQVLKNCRNLRSLRVMNNDDMTDSVLSAITTQHSQLVELNITSCKELTDLSLQSIARNCSSLKRLDIGKNDYLDGNQLALALSQLPKLRWLDVATAEFEPHHWRMIFDHCFLLEHIDISFTYFTPDVLAYMGLKCPRIISVNMRAEGTDERIAALAKALPRLQELCLSQSWAFTSLGIAELARCCKDLRKLDLKSNLHITNADLIALAHGCPQLSGVDFALAGRATSDAGMTLLVQSCPKLETISLPHSDSITDASLVALAHFCPRLQKVSVSNGHSITDAGILAMSTHCIHLKCLSLTGSQITDAALNSLSTHLSKLSELRLQDCKEVTSSGIAQLVRCNNLSSLKVWRCAKVGDAGVIAVVQNCHRLRTLWLWDLSAVTNRFAEVCIALKVRVKVSFNGTGVTADKVALLQPFRL